MCKTDNDLKEIAQQIKTLHTQGYINVNHFLDAQGWHYAHLTLTGWLYRHDVLWLDSYQDYYPAPLPQNPMQLTSDKCTLYFSGLDKNRISQKIRQNISLYQSGHLKRLMKKPVCQSQTDLLLKPPTAKHLNT